MKKLYKFTTIILVSIILVNALLSNIVFADDPLSSSGTDHSQVMNQDAVDRYGETGDVQGSTDADRLTQRPDGTQIRIDTSDPHFRNTFLKSEQGSYLGSQIANVIKMIPAFLQTIMTACVTETSTETNNSSSSDSKPKELFTIQNLLMGKYPLFNINVFDDHENGSATGAISKAIKENVTNWYSTIRTIAIISSLVVLIYVAIRMAISTTAGDDIKYKRMLLAWGTGFLLIFVLHYIAIFLIFVSEQLVNILCALAPKNQVPFEIAVVDRIFYAKVQGWDTVLESILYGMLVWYQAKFFFMYLKRVISNAFFILVSPLVTVTYAIDKSNDMKAQAFNSWLQEFITNIFIQPMHLLLFLVLVYTAGAIAELYPIIAIIMLMGLSQAESILKNLFKLKGASIDNIDAGTSLTGLIRIGK